MNFNLTLLPGDGIGPEVVDAAMKVLNFIADKFKIRINIEKKLIGGASYEKYGIPLTEDTLDTCLNSDAVLLGAVGGYQWEELEHHLKPEAALLKLRKSLELFANIRPAKAYSSFISSSSLKESVLKGTDFIVIRELTSGIYFGQPRGFDEKKGWNTMTYSKEEIVRIARIGFETASRRKSKVTSVDKANVLECSQFWREVVEEVHGEYQGIDLQNMYVDNAAMQIVRDPRQFDVILTSNLFGDILSDIAGMITGSLGMLPSASLGNKYALYEPVHGSAPDIAGKNIANPIATIASVALLFKHSFKMDLASARIEEAIGRTLKQGYRTQDIDVDGEKIANTNELTDAILNNLETIFDEQKVTDLNI